MQTQQTQEIKQTKTIESYGLLDYSLALQQAFTEGYRVDSSSNENCPTSYGGFYTATLQLVNNNPEMESILEQDKQEQKPRKAKEPKTA